MTRHEILDKCPEEFKEELQFFIDETETQVNDCLNQLKSMNSIGDLGQVQFCYEGLVNLSRNLY